MLQRMSVCSSNGDCAGEKAQMCKIKTQISDLARIGLIIASSCGVVGVRRRFNDGDGDAGLLKERMREGETEMWWKREDITNYYFFYLTQFCKISLIR